MTLEQLRIFVAVAERQHVTRAAEALGVAQSAASSAIAVLEGRHGAKLFSRVGRGIELTAAGTLFLEEARAVLARAEVAEMRLAELAGLKRGRLVIQASQTIASYWLPRRLVDFRRAFPAVEIRLTVGNTAQAAAAVLAGAAELGFVEGPVDDASLAVTEVARDNLVLVVAPDHVWTAKQSLRAEDLAEGEWVLREPGSGTRVVFEEALDRLGIPASSLNVVLELPTNEAVRAAVEAGMGATALSASAIVAALESGLLTRLGFDMPARAFNVIAHCERQPSHAAKALVEIIARRREHGRHHDR